MFNVIASLPPYQPESRDDPMPEKNEQLDAIHTSEKSSEHKLYIMQGPWNQICGHIGWGKRTSVNINEQGGILLGKTYIHENGATLFGVVHEAVGGYSANGSPGYLVMSHNTWKEMLDSVDEIIDRHPEKGLQVIGWYHTHPNGLPVFMSGTDMGTQRKFFKENWQFAIVINPHKQIWGAFIGNSADKCKGYITRTDFDESDQTESHLFA